jgi:hypothetical protein
VEAIPEHPVLVGTWWHRPWLEALPDSLLTDGARGEAGRLTAGYYGLLVVEQLLDDDGG